MESSYLCLKPSNDQSRAQAVSPSGDHIMIALALIIVIGSLVASGCLYERLGHTCWAICGSGLLVGLMLFAIKQCYNWKVNSDAYFSTSGGISLKHYDISGNTRVWDYQIAEYMMYLSTKHYNFGYFHLSITPDNLEKDFFDSTSFNLPENRSFENSDLAICIKLEDHWTLVYVDRERHTIEYYDSLFQYAGYKKIIIALTAIGEKLSENGPAFSIIPKINEPLQSRFSLDCGLYVAYFLEERLKNPDVNFNALSNIDMKAYRQHFQDALVTMNKAVSDAEMKERDAYYACYADQEEAMEKYSNDLDATKLTHPQRVKYILQGQLLSPSQGK